MPVFVFQFLSSKLKTRLVWVSNNISSLMDRFKILKHDGIQTVI
jgi:hypothetical protein